MAISRRTLLGQLGALGLASAMPASQARAATHSDGQLVLVIADGGWDVTYALDPKEPGGITTTPSGNQEYQSSLHGIPLQLNDGLRPNVTHLFENWGDRARVINGIQMGTLSHERSMARILSGAVGDTAPDLATLVGSDPGDRPLGTVDLCGRSRPQAWPETSARWGAQGQARMLIDPNAQPVLTAQPGVEPWEPSPQVRAEVDAWLASRGARLQSKDPSNTLLEAWSAAAERAGILRDLGAELTQGLAWGWAASALGDVDLVLELLSRDLCRAVVVGTRQVWDTHERLGLQDNSWNRTASALDQLMTGLADRDLLDTTTILVVSELGRTPRINLSGGKDHWPWTSALVLGGPARGGRVLGGTDAELRGLTIDPYTGQLDTSGVALEPASLLAGVAARVGMDPAWAFPGVTPLDLE